MYARRVRSRVRDDAASRCDTRESLRDETRQDDDSTKFEFFFVCSFVRSFIRLCVLDDDLKIGGITR